MRSKLLLSLAFGAALAACAGPRAAAPPPVSGPPPGAPELASCQRLEQGVLEGTIESSGIAPLPGLKSPSGLPLLATHGDNELTIDVVDPTGRRLSRVDIHGTGDFEALTLVHTARGEARIHHTLIALLSPGNHCIRGRGICTPGLLVRFTLGTPTTGGPTILEGEPEIWRLPDQERTNTESIHHTADGLLLFAKSTGDKSLVELPGAGGTAVVHPLLRQGHTDIQGQLTDMAVDPVSGRIFATSLFIGLLEHTYRLVEIDPTTRGAARIFPLPEDLAHTQVEALTFLPDRTLVLTNEDGVIVRFRCYPPS
jgi:hypothetical protein